MLRWAHGVTRIKIRLFNVLKLYGMLDLLLKRSCFYGHLAELDMVSIRSGSLQIQVPNPNQIKGETHALQQVPIFWKSLYWVLFLGSHSGRRSIHHHSWDHQYWSTANRQPTIQRPIACTLKSNTIWPLSLSCKESRGTLMQSRNGVLPQVPHNHTGRENILIREQEKVRKPNLTKSFGQAIPFNTYIYALG